MPAGCINSTMLATYHIPKGSVGVPSPGKPGWGYAGAIPTKQHGLGLVLAKRVRVSSKEPHTIGVSCKTATYMAKALCHWSTSRQRVTSQLGAS